MPDEEGLIPTPDGKSTWWRGQRRITEERLQPVMMHWHCPKCPDGEMIATGFIWPPPNGHHHKCDKCQYVAALDGESYPRLEYASLEDGQKKWQF